MSDDEQAVLAALVEAWNRFLELPVEHEDDVREFRRMIHAAQEKVMCRPTRRSQQYPFAL
jgi:hypothetical protein